MLTEMVAKHESFEMYKNNGAEKPCKIFIDI